MTVSANGSFTYTPTNSARHAASALSASASDKADVHGDGVRRPRRCLRSRDQRADHTGQCRSDRDGECRKPQCDNRCRGWCGNRLPTPMATPCPTSGSTTTTKGSVAVASDGTFSYTPTGRRRYAAGRLLPPPRTPTRSQ